MDVLHQCSQRVVLGPWEGFVFQRNCRPSGNRRLVLHGTAHWQDVQVFFVALFWFSFLLTFSFWVLLNPHATAGLSPLKYLLPLLFRPKLRPLPPPSTCNHGKVCTRLLSLGEPSYHSCGAFSLVQLNQYWFNCINKCDLLT